MRDTLKMISVLTVVGLVSGLALVSVYKYASPLILENQKSETEAAIFKIFPKAKSYEKEDDTLFRVKDSGGKFLGYVFLAEGNGYQGPIKLMAGIEPDLETLVGIEILDSQETPGLGQEIAGDKFKKQFIGLKVSPEITYVKDVAATQPNEFQAITGATISSRAVSLMLNEKIKTLKKDE